MKVGDKVRLLTDGGYSTFKAGEIHEVIYVGHSTVKLLGKDGQRWNFFYRDGIGFNAEVELVEEAQKPDDRFDIQKQMLKNHNFRYDAYMETRDQILEAEFAKRRTRAQNVYDELMTEERIKIGL